jgi:hypothetical protein
MRMRGLEPPRGCDRGGRPWRVVASSGWLRRTGPRSVKFAQFVGGALGTERAPDGPGLTALGPSGAAPSLGAFDNDHAGVLVVRRVARLEHRVSAVRRSDERVTRTHEPGHATRSSTSRRTRRLLPGRYQDGPFLALSSCDLTRNAAVQEGWRTGLEPATTGTTTRGSTN